MSKQTDEKRLRLERPDAWPFQLERLQAAETDLTDIAQKGTRAITELEAKLADRTRERNHANDTCDAAIDEVNRLTEENAELQSRVKLLTAEPDTTPEGAFGVGFIVGGVFMAIIAVIMLALVWLLSFVGQYEPRIITRDHGGSIAAYAATVQLYKATGQEVRIIGRCDSACTMYLALPTTCVARSAVLGFHGPSSNRYGSGLDPFSFDYWSRVMADHYPEALRPWFMTVARYETIGVLRVSGGVLVDNFGIRVCGQ